MAKQVTVNAKGNAPGAGPVKTPAPTKRVIPTAPDQVSMIRKPSAIGYGMNGDVSPSSIAPGQQRLSPLAANLKASSDDGEGVLDKVIASGTARVDTEITSQLRSIGDKNVPAHPHMKSANVGGAPSGTVPSTTGASSGAPVRKPGA
jgi:hypothetical protein